MRRDALGGTHEEGEDSSFQTLMFQNFLFIFIFFFFFFLLFNLAEWHPEGTPFPPPLVQDSSDQRTSWHYPNCRPQPCLSTAAGSPSVARNKLKSRGGNIRIPREAGNEIGNHGRPDAHVRKGQLHHVTFLQVSSSHIGGKLPQLIGPVPLKRAIHRLSTTLVHHPECQL